MKILLYNIIAAQSSIALMVALLPLFDWRRSKQDHRRLIPRLIASPSPAVPPRKIRQEVESH